MQPVEVRNLVLGQGRPKTIVPIIARDAEAVLAAAQRIGASSAGICEWRFDYFGLDANLEQLLTDVNQALGDKPLLFTVRTAEQGGQFTLPAVRYARIIKRACASGQVDMVDIEHGHEAAIDALSAAASNEVLVVGSFHDTAKTPTREDMIEHLSAMSYNGADVCKLAVRAQSPTDVTRLLQVTAQLSTSLPSPLITMAMGPMGSVTRLIGQAFGSCATYACLDGERSAPGQYELADVEAGLDLVARGLGAGAELA